MIRIIGQHMIELVYQYLMGGMFIFLLIVYPTVKAEYPLMDTSAYMYSMAILMVAWVFLILNVVKASYFERKDDSELILEHLIDRCYNAERQYNDYIKQPDFDRQVMLDLESRYHELSNLVRGLEDDQHIHKPGDIHFLKNKK